MLRSLTLFILVLFTLQATAQSQPQFRLRSFSRQMIDWNNKWSTTDSACYYYPGNRQGMLNWQLAEYLSYASNGLTEPILYYKMQPSLCHDSAATFKEQKPASVYKQTFDNAGRIVTHQRFPSPGATTPVDPENFIYSGNNLVEHTVGSAPSFKKRYEYRYQNGLLDSLLEYQTKQIFAVTKYNYNSSGLLTGTQTYRYNDSVKMMYFYDANNRLSSTLIFVNFFQPTFKFDTAQVITYTYTAGGDLQREEHMVHDYNTGTLILSETHDNMYDATHNKLQDICVTNNSFSLALDDSFKRTYTYNTYGQLTKLESQRWYNGQWDYTPDTIYHRYSHIFTFDYELYWPTGVSQPKEKEANIRLYPSPASGFIRIETEWKEAIPFTVAIYNMQGSLERQWQEQGTKTYSRTVPLSELPAGIHILKMKCGNEEVAKQFIISH